MSDLLPLVNDSFHLLVAAVAKEESEPADTDRYTVDPSLVALYYRGKVQHDGTHFALHTPLGLLSSESIVNWALGSLRMGNGVSFVPRCIQVSAGLVKTDLAFDRPSSALGSLRVPIEQGQPLELLVWGRANSADYTRLPSSDPSPQLELKRLCGVKAAIGQVKEVHGKRFLLLGTCAAGTLFDPRTDIKYPETFHAVFADLDGLKQALVAPVRSDAGERPAKAPKRELDPEPVVRVKQEKVGRRACPVKEEVVSD